MVVVPYCVLAFKVRKAWYSQDSLLPELVGSMEFFLYSLSAYLNGLPTIPQPLTTALTNALETATNLNATSLSMPIWQGSKHQSCSSCRDSSL